MCLSLLPCTPNIPRHATCEGVKKGKQVVLLRIRQVKWEQQVRLGTLAATVVIKSNDLRQRTEGTVVHKMRLLRGAAQTRGLECEAICGIPGDGEMSHISILIFARQRPEGVELVVGEVRPVVTLAA